MTLEEFIRNPVGKGDASTNKQLLMVALDHKYKAWLLKKADAIKFMAYRDSGSSDYYIWFIVPSETDRTNTYDVIFRFYDPEKRFRRELSVRSYDIQIFSNVPSFAYTYAYVYNKNGLLIEALKPKLGKIFFDKEPVVRNQQGLVMYDKYLYYVAKYILDKKYMNRAILEAKSKVYTQKKLFLTKVRSLKQIQSEYHTAQQKIKHKETPHTKTKQIQTTSTTTHTPSPITVIDKATKSVGKKAHMAKNTSTVSNMNRVNKNTKRKRGIH